MKNHYEILKQRLAKAGASINVTLKSLSLGAQGATTGQYVKGYASSTIDMVITVRSTQKIVTPVGEHVQIEAVGYTDTQMFEGDEIIDANENFFVVDKVYRRDVGDLNVVYECVLKSTLPASGSERVYPWPAPPGIEGGISVNVGGALFEALEITSELDDIDVSDWESFVCSITTVMAIGVA